MNEKKISNDIAPYQGNGNMAESIYKTKKDSWMWRQMQNGKPEPGITITENAYGNIRFSKIVRKVASKIAFASENLFLEKTCKQLDSGSGSQYKFYLEWAYTGEFSGTSVNEFNVIVELLTAKQNADLQMINYHLNIQGDDFIEAKIDFENSRVYCAAIIQVPVSTSNGEKNIFDCLAKAGFDTGDSLI